MASNNKLKTALTIIVGAVLFMGCHPRESHSTIEYDCVLPIVPDTVKVSQAAVIADSLVYLGNTGYTVRLPKDFRMTQVTDSSFSFSLLEDTFKCAQLKLEWNYRTSKVPGTRPIGGAEMFVLGTTVEAKEYPLIGVSCIVRLASVKVGSTKLHINCIAPHGEILERQCSIVASLAKTSK